VVRLLVTRPQEDAERTAAALRACGHTVMLASLLRIEPIAAEFEPGAFAAVLTTSANAARAIAAHGRIEELRRLPLYTVGRRSADATKAAGFTTVRSADGDAHDLISIVAREMAGAAARLSREAEQAIAAGELDGVLHYSRRSAETFLRCADAAELTQRALVLTHFCLSAQVAAPLIVSGAARVRVASRPEEEALLELIAEARTAL